MSVFSEIRFDMSRDGLIGLSEFLESRLHILTPELLNFANEIRAMAQKAPAVKEAEWLDG